MSRKKINEDEFRNKIREELEKKFQARKEPAEISKEQKAEITRLDEQTNIAYIKRFIREQIQQEVYSQFPEFIECENHLGEINWLTPLELQESFEFFPIEESRISRFFAKFSRKKILLKKIVRKLKS